MEGARVMSLYRRNARRDENEPEVRDAAEELGATWQPLSIPGGPDALVGWRRESLLVEVKGEKAKLRKSQEKWHAWWQGSPVIVVRNAEQMRAALLGQRVTLSRVLASEQAAHPAKTEPDWVDENGAYPTDDKEAA
jgi:hypothetical protein